MSKDVTKAERVESWKMTPVLWLAALVVLFPVLLTAWVCLTAVSLMSTLPSQIGVDAFGVTVFPVIVISILSSLYGVLLTSLLFYALWRIENQ